VDNGVVILYVVDSGKIWVATGYGVEGILPDSKIGRMLDESYVPMRDEGMLQQGIVNFSYALAQELIEGREEIQSEKAGGVNWVAILILAIVIFMIIIYSINYNQFNRGRFGRRNYTAGHYSFGGSSGGGSILHQNFRLGIELYLLINFSFFSLFHPLISVSLLLASLRVLNPSEYLRVTGLLILV
jgi:hypothetical protein